ncbi:PREDICTED: ribonuclease S-3-like [Prunus mume]|uniref:Ribonuclease S-3-like n=1 Tax=Prunus mume TaxID=102107 RepID=A0ABM1LQL5_PRUMU|nr:PREDICTED: ribonuclease S-3-like [Prunus mume]
MEAAWPNLLTGRKDREFWAYEYVKHSGCGGFPTQNDYFEKTLALWAKNNISKFFEASDIRPGHNKYTLDDLERAIQKKTQRLPLIRTFKELKNATTEYFLWEVIICYDQVGKSRIDCPLHPAPESSQSKANILYGQPPETGKTNSKGEGSDRKREK